MFLFVAMFSMVSFASAAVYHYQTNTYTRNLTAFSLTAYYYVNGSADRPNEQFLGFTSFTNRQNYTYTTSDNLSITQVGGTNLTFWTNLQNGSVIVSNATSGAALTANNYTFDHSLGRLALVDYKWNTTLLRVQYNKTFTTTFNLYSPTDTNPTTTFATFVRNDGNISYGANYGIRLNNATPHASDFVNGNFSVVSQWTQRVPYNCSTGLSSILSAVTVMIALGLLMYLAKVFIYDSGFDVKSIVAFIITATIILAAALPIALSAISSSC